MSSDDAMSDVDGAHMPDDSQHQQPVAPSAPAQPNPLHIQLISDPKLRFVLELEFVELLASPQYLQYLAQSRYLVDPAFLNYLSYLQYWHLPEYVKFISHPHCLYFLDLLQTPIFRTALLHPSYVNLLHEQQYFHWTSGRFNRFMEAEQKREERKREENERREFEQQEAMEKKEIQQQQQRGEMEFNANVAQQTTTTPPQ